ncbi:MAG: hypothetical protein M1833_001067 [Piccolia ochrophora]|nr:MAG: hypothetical protein M1833_001067 [Piccolia ochrophora]
MSVTTSSRGPCPEASDLYNYKLVDKSFDALKFDAAASYQLPSAHKSECEHAKNQPGENLLVVSPYTSRSHLLDLNAISTPHQLLAKGLTVMKPTSDRYATIAYREAFNWDCVVESVRSLSLAAAYCWEVQSFYIVVFRSQVPPSTDRSHLGLLDDKSHEEAIESGGLLKYWFGVPDEDGRNLATCVWRDRDDARRGSGGVGHQLAARKTQNMYTEWKIERLRLVIGHDAQSWQIVDWCD